MPIVRKRHFPFTVTIDEQPIRLRIKRLTVPEFEQFSAEFGAMAGGRGAPWKDAAGAEAPDTFRARLADEVAYLKANAEWLLDVFDRYVTVELGDLYDEDEEGQRVEITSGREFAQMFAGKDVLTTVLAQILLENSLTEDQKKKLQSRSASETGSSGDPALAGTGERPEPIVESVARVITADSAAAMAPSSDGWCGTTAP